jgi:hypothetical protein
MTVTLRQTTQTGATNKGSALTFAELDANFVDLLTNKIQPIQIVGDSGDVTLGEPLQAGRLVVNGAGNISVAATEDSAGNATITITGTDSEGISAIAAGTGISVSTPDSAGSVTITNTNPVDIAINAGTNIDTTAPDSAGAVTISLESLVDGIELKDYKETVHALSYNAILTPDVANGNVQTVTLTGNTQFSGFANEEPGQSVTLIIKQDGTGSRLLTEDSAGRMLFAGGTSTLSTGANAIDILTIFYDGTTYYGSLSTNFS